MAARKVPLAVAIACAAGLVGFSPAASAAPAPAASASQPVIVVLRDQHPDLKPKLQAQQRSAATSNDQHSIVSDLLSTGASKITQLSTISAVAATASTAEIGKLEADPKVAEVLPDRMETLNSSPYSAGKAQPSQQICPKDPAKPKIEPEALDLTHTTEAHAKATGKGVKVAFVADGIDTNNPEFVRPDGSHVFFDYQDFSDDGTNDNSGGDEAFGDASSIAAQGNRTYDLSTELPYSKLPKGCTFKVQGFAPDVSLAGIKVFGENNAPDSAIVRGIDWAVNHDQVDILSESFGSNPYPDNGMDAISLANKAAMDAGVTVVASSGDSGVNGTIGAPASDPRVIAFGGTTAYRDAAAAEGYTGWESNNITALSSGGPTLQNKLVDLVAPGADGMAACTVGPQWGGCSSATQEFGGTSQSAPFVSGAAALVIQSYKAAHGGVKPTPAQVKQLLTGTATDLNTPAAEQGAGLLNSAAAVDAAANAGGLVPNVSQRDLTGKPGATKRTSVTLTNTSTKPQTVTGNSRTLGKQSYSFSKDSQVTGKVAPGNAVYPRAADPVSFTVPAKTPYLHAAMAWPGTEKSGQLALELFDPQGKLVQVSYDYGFSNYQTVDVHDPAAGKWTALIVWSNGRGHYQEAPDKPGTYRGAVHLNITGNQWTTAGFSSGKKTIPAGGSATFDMAVPLSAQAGDAPVSMQFDSTSGTHLSFPIARRSVIPADGPDAQAGAFDATISGGVSRAVSQSLGYYLDVPAGKKNMTVNFTAADAKTALNFYLVSPSDSILAADTNSGAKTAAVTADKPAPGRWKVIVSLPGNVSGNQLSEKVHGAVTFNQANARAVNLPNAAKIPSGHTVNASIEVTNTTAATQNFFLDPRTNTATDLALTPVDGASQFTLPSGTSKTQPPKWLVPTHTTGLTETAQASEPVDVMFGWYLKQLGWFGDPEVFQAAGKNGTTVNTVHGDQLSTDQWMTQVDPVGPFPAGGAKPGVATVNATAHSLAFDPWMKPSTGDVWAQSTGGPAAKPMSIAPGVTSAITLNITPTAPAGTVVHGTVYVDTYNPDIGTGSELLGIPYSYTVS